MKFIKTDHHQQSLVIDQHTLLLLREALETLLKHKHGSIELCDKVVILHRFLENPGNMDVPTFFHKSRSIVICDDCAGSGQSKNIPEDRNEEVHYTHCSTCNGEGQLYMEFTKKGYVPNDHHRKMMTK